MVKQRPLPPLPSVLMKSQSGDVQQQSESNVNDENGNLPAGGEIEEDDAKAEIRKKRKERKKKTKTEKDLLSEKKEEISRKRKLHRIHVKGSDVPPPVET